MGNRVFALLIHQHPHPFESLKQALRDLSVETYSATNRKDAEHLISHCKPQIVFTEDSFEDGSWLNILNWAELMNAPLCVIIVGAHPDMRFYLAVMEKGAHDYVAPPFESQSLGHVIEAAVLETHRRRETLATVASTQLGFRSTRNYSN